MRIVWVCVNCGCLSVYYRKPHGGVCGTCGSGVMQRQLQKTGRQRGKRKRGCGCRKKRRRKR
jgi:hypothetical protein